MDQGRIVEQGPFLSIKENEVFRLLQSEEKEDVAAKAEVAPQLTQDPILDGLVGEPQEEKASITKIHLDEERNIGSISRAVYASYIKAMAVGSLVIVAFCLVAAQASQLGNVLFLGFWAARSISGFDKGHYMGIYAAFGASLGLFTFIGAYIACLAGLQASYQMFHRALIGVLRSPVTFHDRTPSGRIQSR